MRTVDDIESWLLQLDLPFERVAPSMWVISQDAGPLSRVVLFLDDGVAWFRLKVVELGTLHPTALYRRLLELNASDLIHCAYAIEENAVVLVASQVLATFDSAECQAVLDAFAVAVSTHHSALAELLGER